MSRSSIPAWLRQRVVHQAKHRCGYCLTSEEVTGTPLVLDHLIPEALGGPTEEENLWAACSQCNLHKADRVATHDPLTELSVPLFNPRRQRWSDHFEWSGTGEEVVGLTPIGRGTVNALHLNRALLVRARHSWVQAGLHPP